LAWLGSNCPPKTLLTSTAAATMSVTQEDGGRLNAFAKEPPVQVVESGGSIGRTTLLLGGAALVLAPVAVEIRIS